MLISAETGVRAICNYNYLVTFCLWNQYNIIFCFSDYLVWKLAYFSGAVFVGLSCMEDWEVCKC